MARIVRNIMFSFLLFISFFGYGQSSFKEFSKLSCPEKTWVIFHPFVAKKAYKISQEARIVTAEIKQNLILKGIGNGDQIDAFRHTYWMARLSQEMCWRKARKLGKAHERANYKQFLKGQTEDDFLPDKIASEMDLFNNEIGISIGRKNKNRDIKFDVIKAIDDGSCKIIKKDSFGNFLDVNNIIIPDFELKGKWENRKILVNSNE